MKHISVRKKVIIGGFIAIALFLSILQSCATKKDCQGRKHVKHPNGFYISIAPMLLK